MHSFRWCVVLLCGVALASGTGVLYQRHVAHALRAELAVLRTQQRQLADARAEHTRLLAEMPPAEEVKRLQAEQAAVARLRAEIESLKRRADERARSR